MGAAARARHTIGRAMPAIVASSAALALTASPAAAEGTFSVAIDGGPGRVSGNYSINCTRDVGAPEPHGRCSAFVQDQPCDPLDPSCVPFPGLIRVTASGIPGTGFGFDHWTGACSAMNANCQEPVTDDMTATAVFRDTEAPSAGLTATVSGTLRLRADAGDNVGVTQVEFGVRGVRRRTDTRAPYTWSLDTTTIADGPGEITATSFDAAGNSRVTTMNIAVDNSGPTLTIAP